MGDYSAVATSSVREGVLRELLAARGTSWEDVSHSAATTSLTRQIRARHGTAHPIASLVDLIVMPGLPAEMALSLDGFPPPTSEREYESAIREWQGRATGRRIQIGIQFDQALRSFVRLRAPEVPEARALLTGRREFARSVHTLIAAGLRPEHFAPTDALGRMGAAAWQHAEETVPGLTTSRDVLWADPSEVGAASTQAGRETRLRVTEALDAAYGRVDGRRLIVHHGFYFFTPPQWALFRLLRELPDVDQLFIVHDDGANAAFETWRRFFDPIWGMPIPTREPADEGVTAYAGAFRGALSGKPVVADDLIGLHVRDFASPAEMVRSWAQEDATETHGVLRFAADASSVERFAKRLGADGDDTPSLAQLPVGAFLLGLHDCIRAVPGQSAEVALSWDSLLDIAASGYLGLGTPGQPWQLVTALRRAQQFFYGCDSGRDWRNRAAQLVQAIDEHVAPLGERDPGQTDVERIARAVDNPLRAVPWGDLSRGEARLIEAAIRKVVSFAEGLVEHETVSIGAHIAYVRRQVEIGMATLGEDERTRILAKFNGVSAGSDDKIDAEGLADVVSMLLGRDAEFDAFGEDAQDDLRVQQLRALDGLGLVSADEPIHVANLADTNFPTRRGAQTTWPLRYEDLRLMDDGGPDDTVSGLLELRDRTATLSDLYLMWLALDGADASKGLVLSWLSKVDGEKRNLSPLVGLLTIPNVVSEHVKHLVGGLGTESMATGALGDETSVWPSPESDSSPTPADIGRIDRRAAASAIACPRRTALQWLLGASAAFGPDYLQEMLYGNVLNALVRLRLADNLLTAGRAANMLWSYLTPGQRVSSQAKSVVKSAGRPSADPVWLLTLQGSQNGEDPLSRAYQAARSGRAPDSGGPLIRASEYFPRGVDDAKVCARCPVQDRCLTRTPSEW